MSAVHATAAPGPGDAGPGSTAAEALGPEAALVARIDPVSFGPALGRLGLGLAMNPVAAGAAWVRYVAAVAGATAAAGARALGVQVQGPIDPEPEDRRFADPAWETNAWFFLLKERHLLLSRLLQDMAERSVVDDRTREKARFALRLLSDALAPSNRLWSNPAALKLAFETGGLSLARGSRNFLEDVLTNGGRPRQVDTSNLAVGRDMACTPGKVVFRNDLMELIQYAPQTRSVYETPLLASPPWINKYYIMDLSPGRSFLEWAVQHGHTVFAISYRNPGETMRDVTLDDYLLSGPLQAIEVIGQITGAAQVNLVGLCLGGTLTAMLLAYLAVAGDPSVRSATLLNTLVDFSEPGPLGVFCDPRSVDLLEERMKENGYLPSTDMAMTFDLLRANDLIFNYVVSNWLMGQDPPAFDILAWNADGTRMPADMHAFYLRSCYLENRLAKGEMELAGRRLELSKVTQDVYVLAAERDHIAPWTAQYRTAGLLGGDTRFVLSSSGHVAGIVNPPGPKAVHRTSDERPAEPSEWLVGATERRATWWEDWTEWAAGRGGRRRRPPRMGSPEHPPLADAPGSYVLEK